MAGTKKGRERVKEDYQFGSWLWREVRVGAGVK